MARGWFKRNKSHAVKMSDGSEELDQNTPSGAVAEYSSSSPPMSDLAPFPVPVFPTASMTPPAAAIPEDKIAARAYEIWVRQGRPSGGELQNWLAAEAELLAEFSTNRGAEQPIRKSR